MSSFNGLAYNDLISIRDLLQRAKTKTRQKTYRNHHLEGSATTSQTVGQLPKQPELNDGALTSLIVPAPTSLSDEQNNEAIVGPPIEEQLYRPRSRSPRVNQTYSKKTTSHAQQLLIEAPQQRCPRKKSCQRIHTSSKGSAELESGYNDDEYGAGEEKARRKTRIPRRGTCFRSAHHIFIYSQDISPESFAKCHTSVELLTLKASSAPEERPAVVKSIEKPRSSRTPSSVRPTVRAHGVSQRCRIC